MDDDKNGIFWWKINGLVNVFIYAAINFWWFFRDYCFVFMTRMWTVYWDNAIVMNSVVKSGEKYRFWNSERCQIVGRARKFLLTILTLKFLKKKFVR